VQTASSRLNVTKLNESAEQLGAKAMSADKKPEDFDKINDYISYLQNEVKINKLKLGEETKTNTTTQQGVGLAIMLKGMGEKLGTEISLPFLKTTSLQNLTAAEIIEVINSYRENGLSTNDYTKYLNKELDINDLDKHANALVSAYQKANPELSEEEAETKVMSLMFPKTSL
jgi:hypothetical protein